MDDHLRNVVGAHGKERKHFAGGLGPVADGSVLVDGDPGLVAGIQGVHGDACHLAGFPGTQGGSPCRPGSVVVHLA